MFSLVHDRSNRLKISHFNIQPIIYQVKKINGISRDMRDVISKLVSVVLLEASCNYVTRSFLGRFNIQYGKD